MEMVSGVPIIMAACYLLIEAVKIIGGKRDWLMKLLPIISALLGGGLGALLYLTLPQLLPASNIAVSIVLGLFSGLSATGSNQILKQMKDFFKEKED